MALWLKKVLRRSAYLYSQHGDQRCLMVNSQLCGRFRVIPCYPQYGNLALREDNTLSYSWVLHNIILQYIIIVDAHVGHGAIQPALTFRRGRLFLSSGKRGQRDNILTPWQISRCKSKGHCDWIYQETPSIPVRAGFREEIRLHFLFAVWNQIGTSSSDLVRGNEF